MEVEDHRKNKSEQKLVRDYGERFKGLETCEALVRLVFVFDMDHINNPKGKDLMVILCYHFGSEKLKGGSKKVGFVEAVKYLLKYWDGIVQRWGGGGVSVVTIEGVHEAREDMG